MNDNFKHNYKYMYNTDWRDNKELHIRRLHNLKEVLKLKTGDVIFTDKKIISLIYRGFSNDEIYDFAQELFYFWDHPTYWQTKERESTDV